MIVVQVFAAAAAGFVHDAAQSGSLTCAEFRQEFMTLIDGYLSGRH
jgi:hypothetical protein